MSNVPKLRFPEFEGEWEEETLDQLGSFKKGSILGRQDLSSEGTPCILYGELYTKYGEITTSVESRTEKDYCGFLRSEYGDILIPASGETADDISTSTCLLLSDVIIGGDINLYRSKKVDGRYLSYLLNHKKKNEIARLAQGASVVHIYSAQLKNVKIPKPSAAEQTKIADFFTLIDKKITKQDEKVAALEQYKKGLMQKIFAREIRFKDDGGKYYPEWKEVRISDIFSLTRGVVIAKDKLSRDKTEKYSYPVYSSQTLNNGILGHDDTYDFSGNHLTWTTDGANAGRVFFRTDKFRCTNVCGVMLEKNDTKGYANSLVKEILNKETPKQVSYVGNPKLMNNIMSSIRITVPVLPEQTKIANFLSLYDRKIEKEKAKIDALREQKKGLLQQMFV